MRTRFFIGLIAIFCSCANQQQNDQPSDKTETTGTAKFEFQEEMHNFGSLQAGEVVAFSFSFCNTGDAFLTINKVETECGCLNVEYPKTEIKPGEQTYIEVVFNSAGEVGRVYKTISIQTNAGIKELAIAATVENKVLNLYSKN